MGYIHFLKAGRRHPHIFFHHYLFSNQFSTDVVLVIFSCWSMQEGLLKNNGKILQI